MVQVTITVHPLKAIRMERKISTRDLETLTGVNKSTINRFENGKDIFLSHAMAIAKALSVSVEEIYLNGKRERNDTR